MNEDLKYPIGNFQPPQEVTSEMRDEFIQTIEELPSKFHDAVDDLDDNQLDTPYRPEGWTVRQVVHHIADSHINSFCRFKLGLSEETPTIKPFDEASWAEMNDSAFAPVDLSLNIIDGVHARWALLLKSMSGDEFERKINHPERGEMTLNNLLALYDWHGKHHTAHIMRLRERNDW
ncbi:MAG: YfiT family bacillithiol transferase [Pyrinomonadaceae bacterium]